MGDFQPATQGVSNFVTSPDFIPSILLRNATEQQIIECMEQCRNSGRVFNVYVQTETSTEDWVLRVESIADTIIDAEKENPADYFQ